MPILRIISSAVLMFFAGLFLTGIPVQAQNTTIEWVGGSGVWTTPTSWTRIPGPGNGPPNGTDVALISVPNVLVSLEGTSGSSANGTFDLLTIEDDGLVSVQGYATLTGGNVTVGTGGQEGTLQVLNEESVLDLGTVTLGNGTGSRGELNVTSGGVAGLEGLIIGSGGGCGTLFVGSGAQTSLESVSISVSGTGSAITLEGGGGEILTESLTLSEGTLSAASGSLVRVQQTGEFVAGNALGKSATLTFTGATLEVLPTTALSAVIGDSGNATLSAVGGSSLTFDGLILGKNNLSNGTLTLSDSTLRTYGSIQVGQQGHGELVVRSGATLTAKSDTNVLQTIFLGSTDSSGRGTLVIGGNATTAPGTIEAAAIEGTSVSYIEPYGKVVVAHSSASHTLPIPLNGSLEAEFLAGTTLLTANSTLTGNITIDNSASVIVNAEFTTINAGRTIHVGANATLGGTGSLIGNANVEGILSPGSGGIGTLGLEGNVTWNANIDRPWRWDLGAGNQSDRLDIEGSLIKGSGSLFFFDFSGFTPVGEYTLLTWDLSNGIDLDEFHAVGFAPGTSLGEFSFSGKSLVVSVIPEFSSAAFVGALTSLAVLLRLRKRRLVAGMN